jgi:hypothetical protein
MFKKINFKSILIGIIIGIVLTSSVFADISSIQVWFNDIKVSLDGVILEMKDAKGNPVQPMVYNGTTYLPARALCEALGKDIKMNEITNVLEITTPTVSTTTNITGKEETSLMSEGTTTTPNFSVREENGLLIVEAKGQTYLDIHSLNRILDNNYKIYFDAVHCNLMKLNSNNEYVQISENIMLQENLGISYNNKMNYGLKEFILYDDYINKLKPLIKE